MAYSWRDVIVEKYIELKFTYKSSHKKDYEM
jgi:hypothetical protein